jgi:DNA primase
MGRIPDDVIDRVLAAHDVVEVLGRHLTLKRAGRAFKALCPFHEEKTPSFTVNPDRQTFKCFGCGKGGTVITFLMEHHRLTFPEAVRSLAAERGIEVPTTRGDAAQPPGELERVRKALAFAQAMFAHLLAGDEGREARAYLEKRGYDEEARKRFGLGYAPQGWDRLLTAAGPRGWPAPVLEAAGLVVPRKEGDGHYDRFRHRVTFPVRDLQGRVVTFGARALAPDDNPKYLNGPETAVFHKGAMLFGLDLAGDGMRKAGEALLMEGYTDTLMAHRFGFDRAVAGMGTAFTLQQAALLKRFADRVVLVYDADAAGRAAAERAIDVLLETGLEVRVALLPEGRDVDEILLEEGAPAFQAVLDKALDVFAFRMAQIAVRHDLRTPRGAAAAARELGPTLARVKNPVERDLWIAALVERLGGGAETEQVLRRDLAARQEGARPAPRSGAAAPVETPGERLLKESAGRDEVVLLSALVVGGPTADRIARAVGSEDFADAARCRVYKAVLDFREAGVPHDARVLLARFADDPEASAALADLQEHPNLAEQALHVVNHLEKRRVNARLREAGTRARGAQDQEGPLQDIVDGRLSLKPGPSSAPASPPPTNPKLFPGPSGPRGRRSAEA